MSKLPIGEHNVHEIAYWGLRFREEFGDHEEEWKLRGYARLALGRDALVAGKPDWAKQVVLALRAHADTKAGGLGTVVAWQMVDLFKKWIDADPARASAALLALWAPDASWPASMNPLLQALGEIHRGPGYRLSLVAALAGATDPRTRVPYKDYTYRTAYRLAGYPAGPGGAEPLAAYEHALSFLDAVAAASSAQGTKVNRLQAHDLVWYAMKYAPPASWAADDVEALGRFRGKTTSAEHLAEEVERDLDALAADVEAPADAADARERMLRAIFERTGQPAFRSLLGKIYNNRCPITACDCREALEAAHIVAVASDGGDDAPNGMLLRADLHTLFDRGLLAIDTDTWTVVLHPRLREGSYKALHAAPFDLPAAPAHRPSAVGLQAHRQRAGF